MKRAKLAMAFAFTISLFTSLQPANAQLLDTVTDILDVTTGVAGAAVGATLYTAEGTCGLPVGVTRDQIIVRPVVITTTVIPYPPLMSDLPIRRRDLEAKIDDAAAAGALSTGEHSELKTALGAVVGAESTFAADGRIDNFEARKLYKAMDQIGSDYDWYVDDGGVTFLGIRVRDDLSVF